jgi:hypothetical protein
VNQNWLIDCRVGCKTLYNLVELSERDLNLKKGFLKFENLFEQDEIKLLIPWLIVFKLKIRLKKHGDFKKFF